MSVTIERLPPERDVHGLAIAPAGHCSCCCCCCCLHTIGGVIGALTAKMPPLPTGPTAIADSPKAEPKYSVKRDYWLTVLIISTVVFPLMFFRENDMNAGAWALIYAVFFPVIQLAASIVVLIQTSISKRPGREQRIRHLGSISLRAFVGACIGMGVMLLVWAAL
jgi:hypothetical protein